MKTYKDKKMPSWAQGVLWLLAGLTALYLFSFALFAEGRRADALQKPDLPQADGIVVLTGSSKRRIEEGLSLMADKHGRRVLITGVHENVSMDDIFAISPIAENKIACCVDLDYRATNTVGNAQEAALWARIHGYRSLILVTSTQHVPRSLIEMRRTMPNTRLTPYPVNPPGIRFESWWRNPGTFFLLLGEYSRYLLALFDLAGDHKTPY
ncbi:MAG: YdcF family protein [Parvibaculales bacterium]